MKLPRVRFTIAGLMGLVLLVGVGLWYDKQARKRRSPSMAETEARFRHWNARIVRELAEAELEVAESEQGLEQAQRAATEHIRLLETQTDRWKLTKELMRPLISGKPGSGLPEAEKTPEQKDQLRAICDKIARHREAEAAAQAEYDRERARRLSWW